MSYAEGLNGCEIECGTWILRSAVQTFAVRGAHMYGDHGFRESRRVLGRYHVHGQMLVRNVQTFHGLARGEAGSAAQN